MGRPWCVRSLPLHPAGARARLERVCRYALRPPVAQARLRWTGGGQVLLGLRHRWTDGTTHLLFDPLDLLARLAAVTPRPRINLVLYYGVLGAQPSCIDTARFSPDHPPCRWLCGVSGPLRRPSRAPDRGWRVGTRGG
jgi:hypothetical protein